MSALQAIRYLIITYRHFMHIFGHKQIFFKITNGFGHPLVEFINNKSLIDRHINIYIFISLTSSYSKQKGKKKSKTKRDLYIQPLDKFSDPIRNIWIIELTTMKPIQEAINIVLCYLHLHYNANCTQHI